jgi:hypothetical protein
MTNVEGSGRNFAQQLSRKKHKSEDMLRRRPAGRHFNPRPPEYRLLQCDFGMLISFIPQLRFSQQSSCSVHGTSKGLVLEAAILKFS